MSHLPAAEADQALRRLLLNTEAGIVGGRSRLAMLDGSNDPDGWDAPRLRLNAIERPVFPLAGQDAATAGVSPGPAAGATMSTVEDWWRAGGCRADRAACRAAGEVVRSEPLLPPVCPVRRFGRSWLSTAGIGR